MLRSAQLYKKDFATGKEGFTLAAVLLFGKDETILNVLPYHKTDALLRKKNIDRYDDRDDIRTNLIESYERLMAFCSKHLPDPFYLENYQRVSLRNKICREAIVNCLIHREYSSPYPAKMIIKSNLILFENANKSHGYGLIDPSNFSPYPKNPVIARVFKEIGFAEELGSGVRNLFKYTKEYSGGKLPQLIEDDIFTITIPVAEQATEQATEQAAEQATEQHIEITPVIDKDSEEITEQVTEQAVLDFCIVPKSAKEIMDFMGLSHREYFRSEILKPLLKNKLLFRTAPDKPKSPMQKYFSKQRNKKA